MKARKETKKGKFICTLVLTMSCQFLFLFDITWLRHTVFLAFGLGLKIGAYAWKLGAWPWFSLLLRLAGKLA
jgi:hypothetical protein